MKSRTVTSRLVHIAASLSCNGRNARLSSSAYTAQRASDSRDAQSHTHLVDCSLLLQDLEKYIRENRKRDAVRVMRGMKRWELRGLEAGLEEMGVVVGGLFQIVTTKCIAIYNM